MINRLLVSQKRVVTLVCDLACVSNDCYIWRRIDLGDNLKVNTPKCLEIAFGILS